MSVFNELPFGVLGASAVVQLAGLLVWGATLNNRVKTIERDIEPLRSMTASVARMEARLDSLMDQLRDLNASMRWGRNRTHEDAPGGG